MKLKISYIVIVIILILTQCVYAKDTLKVGLIKYKKGDIAAQVYKPLVEYIARKIDRIPYLEVVDDEQLGYELSNNKYDIGIFTPFPYLESKIHYPELEPFATNSVRNQSTYKGAIIVKKSSKIKTLYDLKGKKFLFIRPSSTSGYKVPKSIFLEYNINIDSGFFHYDFSKRHTKSIQMLLADSVSGIAIDLEGLEDFPKQDIDKLLILEEYDVPNQAYVFSPSMSQEFKNRIKKVMFNAYKDPTKDSLFLNELEINNWVPADDELFNPLRRYLRLVRIKPYTKINFDIAESAKQSLAKKGDLLDIIYDNIEDEIKSCKRFADKSPNHENVDNFYNISISLSRMDKGYYYQIYLNDDRIDKGLLTENELISSLHAITINAVLNTMDISAQLLQIKNKWFITYGANDGINVQDYIFTLENGSENGNEQELEIDTITDLNTFIKSENGFLKGHKIKIKYTKTGKQLNYFGLDALEVDGNGDKEGFWDKLDNIWGVIGIIVALITILISYLLSKRKHKRFRNMLYNSNDLLKDYIEGKFKIEARLIEQREAINRGLEVGHINENQFMILTTRLEDIRNVIENQQLKSEIHRPEVKSEIDKILADGKITEKEYTRIMSLISKIRY